MSGLSSEAGLRREYVLRLHCLRSRPCPHIQQNAQDLRYGVAEHPETDNEKGAPFSGAPSLVFMWWFRLIVFPGAIEALEQLPQLIGAGIGNGQTAAFQIAADACLAGQFLAENVLKRAQQRIFFAFS